MSDAHNDTKEPTVTPREAIAGLRTCMGHGPLHDDAIANAIAALETAERERGPMCQQPGCKLSVAACDRRQLREALDWLKVNVPNGEELIRRAFEEGVKP